MFYINFIFLLFFYNVIIGVEASKIKKNVFSRLRNKNNKKKIIQKKIKLNKNKYTAIKPMNLQDSSIKKEDINFAKIIAAIFIPCKDYFHIFAYIKHFFNTELKKNKKIMEDAVEPLVDDLSIFQELLENLISSDAKINKELIGKYILENNPKMYEEYFSSKKVSFLFQNSYGVDINPDTLVIIDNFFEDNDIKVLLKKKNSNLTESEKYLLFLYDFFNNLMKNNILYSTDKIDLSSMMIVKKKEQLNEKEIIEYLNLLVKKIKEDKLTSIIINNYLFSLLLTLKIIPMAILQNIVSKTMFNKKNTIEALQIIDKALKSSTKLMDDLWEIISKEKETFIDNSSLYEYIKKIDAKEGITKYLKDKLTKNIQKNNILTVERKKKYLASTLKAIGVGVLIGAGVYAASQFFGGTLLVKTMGLANGIKNNIFNWYKSTTSEELVLKTLNTNFIGSAVSLMTSQSMNIMNNRINSLLSNHFPSLAQSIGSSFILGMGVSFIQKRALDIINSNVIQPIAQKVGIKRYNFNIYNYIKEKGFNYLNTNSLYLPYKLTTHNINESALIYDLFVKASLLQNGIINKAQEHDDKVIKEVESLVKERISDRISSLKNERKAHETEEYYRNKYKVIA